MSGELPGKSKSTGLLAKRKAKPSSPWRPTGGRSVAPKTTLTISKKKTVTKISRSQSCPKSRTRPAKNGKTEKSKKRSLRKKRLRTGIEFLKTTVPRRQAFVERECSPEGIRDQMLNVKVRVKEMQKEHVMLKSHIRRLERALRKKEKHLGTIVDMALEENEHEGRSKSLTSNLLQILKSEQAANEALKHKSKTLQSQLEQSQEELEKVKSSMKFNSIVELRSQMKQYYDEVMHSRKMLRKCAKQQKRNEEQAAEAKQFKKVLRQIQETKEYLNREKIRNRALAEQAEDARTEMAVMKQQLRKSEQFRDKNRGKVMLLKNRVRDFENHLRRVTEGNETLAEKSTREAETIGRLKKQIKDLEQDIQEYTPVQRQWNQFRDLMTILTDNVSNPRIATLLKEVEIWWRECAYSKANLGKITKRAQKVIRAMEKEVAALFKEKEGVTFEAGAAQVDPAEAEEATLAAELNRVDSQSEEEFDESVKMNNPLEPVEEEEAGAPFEKIDEEETHAAKTIQCQWRYRKKRKSKKAKKKKTITAKSLRETHALKPGLDLKKSTYSPSLQEHRAATTIQCQWKYQNRKKKKKKSAAVKKEPERVALEVLLEKLEEIYELYPELQGQYRAAFGEQEKALAQKVHALAEKYKVTASRTSSSREDRMDAATELSVQTQNAKDAFENKKHQLATKLLAKGKKMQADGVPPTLSKEVTEPRKPQRTSSNEGGVEDVLVIQAAIRARSRQMKEGGVRASENAQRPGTAEDVEMIQSLVRAKQTAGRPGTAEDVEMIQSLVRSKQATTEKDTEEIEMLQAALRSRLAAKKSKTDPKAEQDVELIQSALRLRLAQKFERLQSALRSELDKKNARPSTAEDVEMIQSLVQSKQATTEKDTEEIEMLQAALRSRLAAKKSKTEDVELIQSALRSDKKEDVELIQSALRSRLAQKDARPGTAEDVELIQSALRSRLAQKDAEEDVELIQAALRSRMSAKSEAEPTIEDVELLQALTKVGTVSQEKAEPAQEPPSLDDIRLMQALARAKLTKDADEAAEPPSSDDIRLMQALARAKLTKDSDEEPPSSDDIRLMQALARAKLTKDAALSEDGQAEQDVEMIQALVRSKESKPDAQKDGKAEQDVEMIQALVRSKESQQDQKSADVELIQAMEGKTATQAEDIELIQAMARSRQPTTTS